MTPEIEELRRDVEMLKEQIAGFVPVTVDLRIDGTVRPVVLFARQEFPAAATFTIVR